MNGNSEKLAPRVAKKSASAHKYDYVSTLLDVMRELDNEYTLNPNANVSK